MADPEVRHFRAFVAVLDAGTFTAAAEHLRVAQPALSRLVATLERHVGQRLIDRRHQPLQTTRAGAALLPQARRLLEVADEALGVLDARPTTLRVGFAWNAAGSLTSAIIGAFEAAHPGITVRLRRFDTAGAGVDDGRSHLSLVRTQPKSPRVDSAVLFEEQRVAAVPLDHPAASWPQVSLAILGESPVVVNVVSGTTTPQLWPGREAGRALFEVHNTEEWIHAIALGRGVGVTVASTAQFYAHPDVRYVPLEDAPPVAVLAIWPKRGRHPLVTDFVEIAQRTAIDAGDDLRSGRPDSNQQ